MYDLNETHDKHLKSWVDSANTENTDFPIQNLPFAVFRRRGADEPFRGGVAIGGKVIDMAALAQRNLFDDAVNAAVSACAESSLNHFMGMGRTSWAGLRLALSRALRVGSAEQSQLEACLIDQADIEFTVPCRIGDYTDFYTSIHHATNVGKLFRPDNPLLPNYKWLPIGYHGRASSIVISGQAIKRPLGQTKAPDADAPSFGPSKRLDYELEVGIYIGSGNDLGTPVAIEQADEHVFGYCIFNDWSARDIQPWEYVPLGPFLAKSFASTISPWIVTNEAMTPFRKPWTRDAADPQPLAYLDSDNNRQHGALDLKLQVSLQTAMMREQGIAPVTLGESSFADSYWTTAQMLAHHSSNGCNLQPGDFFGSGTQSGPNEDQWGSLLEVSRGGKRAITLPSGESRSFLQDGDEVIMSGWCEAEGAARIGFGTAQATILPAD